jgi:hypothetical protein
MLSKAGQLVSIEKGNQMSELELKKRSQSTAMLLLGLLSALSAAVSTVMPLIIHA